MSKEVYIAQVKGGSSLGEMVEELNRIHGKCFSGFVFEIGRGMLWENCPGNNPPNRKVGILGQGTCLGTDVTSALDERTLLFYSATDQAVVKRILESNGYTVMELPYETK